MKQLLFVLGLIVPALSFAQDVPDGFVVNQTTGVTAVAIYAVNGVTIVSKKTEGSWQSQVLRLFVNVVAEGNLCGGKGLFLQNQLINPSRSTSDYELSLQSLRPLSINEEPVGCTLGGKMTRMSFPLIIDSGSSQYPFAANYFVRTSSVTGPAGVIKISITRTGTDWKTNISARPLAPAR